MTDIRLYICRDQNEAVAMNGIEAKDRAGNKLVPAFIGVTDEKTVLVFNAVKTFYEVCPGKIFLYD